MSVHCAPGGDCKWLRRCCAWMRARVKPKERERGGSGDKELLLVNATLH